MKALKVDDQPKEIVSRISEDLLARFGDLPLLSPYDAYQRLMDYWVEVMQDDVYLVVAEGWVEAAKPRTIIEDKERKIKEVPDLTVKRRKYKLDLLPPTLVVARYFSSEQAALNALRVKQEATLRELEEFVEERSGEEGPLTGVTNEQGKVTKSAVKERLSVMEAEAEEDEEWSVLTRCLELIEADSVATRAVNDALDQLDRQVLAQYATLTEAEVKALVVEDKWFASLMGAVDGEVDRLTQQLSARVKELDGRYAQPLPALEREEERLGAKVDGHLKSMGLAWS